MNPVLLSANSNVGLAKENIEFERSGHYPTLDLVAQKGYTSQSDSNLSGSNKTHQKILGLQINIPIYAGGVVNSRTREASFRLDEAMKKDSGEQLYVRPVPPITASCQALAGSMRCSRRYIPIKRHWSPLKRVLMSAQGQP